MVEMPGVVSDKMKCLVYHASRILARSREALQLYSVKGCRLPGWPPDKPNRMGTLYQESALHRSLRLSMGGFCVSDYIKRFTVRDSLVLYCEPGLKVKISGWHRFGFCAFYNKLCVSDILGQVVQCVGLQNTCQRQGGVSEMMTAGFAFVNKFTFHESLGILKLLLAY